MSLLAPLFLLGALAIAVPIIAHLVRRSTRERVLFSATHFLEATPPRMEKRSRLEHPWLLLLRVLAILALVAGFARPFLSETPPAPNPDDTIRHTVVVLDESASMRRQGLWEAAVSRTRTIAADLASDDRFALIAAGRSGSVLIGSNTWAGTSAVDRPGILATALDSRSPGWSATHLDTAIETALDELLAMNETERPSTEAEIVVVSDFATGARISGLAGRDWPAGVTLRLETLPAPATPNASLHWLGWTTSSDGERQARLRLAHDADTSRPYRLQLRDAGDGRVLGEPEIITLAPHETRAVTFAVPANQTAPVRVELAGDETVFDNTVWLVVPEVRAFPLPYLGIGDTSDPRTSLFYLSRATVGWREPSMVLQPIAPPTTELPEAPLYVVGGPLTSDTTAVLRDRLERGAFALVLAQDAGLVATAGALAGEEGWTLGPTSARGDALLADIAFRHPLFAPFADPRYSDFTHVRFWQRTSIRLPDTTSATVAARFDDGTPAVIETPVGRGAVVVWAGDWQPAASQWVLSTKFVPWFQALARRAAGGPPPPSIAEIGDSVTHGEARTPGIHTLAAPDGPRVIALNVPAAESRLTAIPLDAWEQLGAPLSTLDRGEAGAARDTVARDAVRAGSLAAAQLEADQKLWRWLLLATAALLAFESLLATRLATRRALSTPATST